MSLWAYIVKGGPMMVPIILGSIIGLALVIDRLYVFWTIRADNKGLFRDIKELIHRGEIQMAISLCEKTRGPVAALFKIGLSEFKAKKDYKDIDLTMQQEGSAQIISMERGLSGLGIIVTIEPMLGFLGTIVGLISAFMNWERLGANISINLLAGGMYQAMITTATGLIIAIPYYVVYNLFIKRIQDYGKEMDIMQTRLLQSLFTAKGKAVNNDKQLLGEV